MVKGFRVTGNEWDRAVLETYSLLLEYVHHDFHENIILSEIKPKALYHNFLHMNHETCRFKTIDGNRLNQLESNPIHPELSVQRVIYQLSEYTQDERELAIKFVHYCHENGLNLKEPQMLQTLPCMMPFLLQHSCQEGPFAQHPLRGVDLYLQVWKSMEAVKDYRELSYPISDDDTDIRPVLDSGIMNWIGRDDSDRPILLIDLNPERMKYATTETLSDARKRLIKTYLFCVEWARRYLFLPGMQESANVVLDIRGINPLSVLMSNIRDTVTTLSAIHYPNFLNKMWIVNDSYHWRTLWDVYRPMLPKSVQHKIIFIHNVDHVRELSLLKNKNKLPSTGNYPFKPFIDANMHSEDDIKKFHNLWDNPKAMNSCPWILWKSTGYCQNPRCDKCKTLSMIYPDIYASLRNSYQAKVNMDLLDDPLLKEYKLFSSSTTLQSVLDLSSDEKELPLPVPDHDEFAVKESVPLEKCVDLSESGSTLPPLIVARKKSEVSEDSYDDVPSPAGSMVKVKSKPSGTCQHREKSESIELSQSSEKHAKKSDSFNSKDINHGDEKPSYIKSLWYQLARKGLWMTYNDGHYITPREQRSNLIIDDIEEELKTPRQHKQPNISGVLRRRQKKQENSCWCVIE